MVLVGAFFWSKNLLSSDGQYKLSMHTRRKICPRIKKRKQMGMGFKHFISILLAGLGHDILAVHVQDQSGFISIACGLPANSRFKETKTGINYISDETFIDSGISKSISPEFTGNQQQYVWNLRSFPQGNRNCYTINVTAGTKYLIGATFLYGNYDGIDNLPQFDLYLGPNTWDTVKVVNSSLRVVKQLIHVPSRNYVHFCLVNTGLGTPFISAIELRPLINTSYVTTSGSLSLFSRLDVGSTSNQGYRYGYDVHDRYWVPYNKFGWTDLSTSLTIDTTNSYQPPSVVMSTAVTPVNGNDSLQFSWDSEYATSEYYVYMYFAEVVKLEANQYRSFNIAVNENYWYGPFAPNYLKTNTLDSSSALSGKAKYEISIFKTENSTFPPIINAIEIYSVKYLLQSETVQGDVDAIAKIKSTYGIKRTWQGDPCAPKEYPWEGLNCSYDGYTPPRITSLNLSSSGLIGEISADISNLVMLQYLDLSNNNLTGSVPNFLSQLQYLRILNLERNQLSGSVPTELIARSKNGRSLSSSVGDNPNLCGSDSCKQKKNNFVVPIVASLGGLLILSLIVAAIYILLGIRRRKHQDKTKAVVIIDARSNIQNVSLESIQRQFTYPELLKITNFERIDGKGGFGTVYHGTIDDTQVAVKMLSPSSIQGFQRFQSEVKLLMKVHHRNLTTLVGFCYEGSNMWLIYEYMANGNLKEHLSGEKANILNWEDRIQIATDAAQGLEYLHRGCKPPIIHRDVKSTHILLTENFHAKLADFGLSKIFPCDGGSHMSTDVAGSPGYLDPEYYISNKLTEKSDVYSFGVVLLEIITSRPALERSHERTHISQWVSFLLAKGDIKSIVDPRLGGNFNIYSAWKAVEIAMVCVSPTSAERPTMSQVVAVLNECLPLELARTKEGNEYKSIDLIDDQYESHYRTQSFSTVKDILNLESF
ncbi:LRR receptor-like serine/threonine-protein kinase IOS1 [Corylus avellana]|uniref:LRR receptor-like serine/threonine-protein kinase IOS1 n=1 Tax=Corylus avellana TaxID=13451 RepID=UPI00286CA3B7|nr:LRR receptor-like serine/threonine-protein kinase IOS1 [Corylus avellana]